MKPAGVAVAAPHVLAVDAAEAAVRDGGNALDAALAAAVMLAVVYPHQCSLGGDMTALVRSPGEDPVVVLSLGSAPRAMDPEALAETVDEMPAYGPMSVTVPGVVAGWNTLAGLGAELGLRAPLERAATAAERGAPVSPGLAEAIQTNAQRIRRDPGLSELLLRGGWPLRAGDTVGQPRLAMTLAELADDPDSFYRGPVGERLAAGLEALGSPISLTDLEAHVAELEVPLSAEVGVLRWWAAPPPAQGATALAMLDDHRGRDLLARAIDAHRARDALLGDPRSGPIDVEAMLRPRPSLASTRSMFTPAGDTAAASAVDSQGWSIVVIQSVFHAFGAGLLEPHTGIVMHNRGAAFRLTDDTSDPARLAPGRRPPHTLCPLLGESSSLRVALGCQGGWAQPLILAQVAPRAADSSISLADTLDSPRWVLAGSTEVLQEPGAAPIAASGDVKAILARRYDSRCGHVQAARAVGHRFEAASDPRADGRAAVV